MSVYNRLLHEKGFRLLGGILGAALMASAINLFIVPQGFYAGGAYGLCQVIRTLLVTRAGLSLPFDLAGLLYLLVLPGWSAAWYLLACTALTALLTALLLRWLRTRGAAIFAAL